MKNGGGLKSSRGYLVSVQGVLNACPTELHRDVCVFSVTLSCVGVWVFFPVLFTSRSKLLKNQS